MSPGQNKKLRLINYMYMYSDTSSVANRPPRRSKWLPNRCINHLIWLAGKGEMNNSPLFSDIKGLRNIYLLHRAGLISIGKSAVCGISPWIVVRVTPYGYKVLRELGLI
jgi:hypothetical protein